jgi:hypothetical protein
MPHHHKNPTFDADTNREYLHRVSRPFDPGTAVVYRQCILEGAHDKTFVHVGDAVELVNAVTTH